jgi:hypothetical protein
MANRATNHINPNDNLLGMDTDDLDGVRAAAQVISNPDAIVDGLTIRAWSEEWLKALINSKAGKENGFNDPHGEVAEKINNSHSPMYFITGAPSGAVRTFEVHAGQDVMIPVVGVTDSEGPGINPTIPNFVPPHTFAEEVQTVLNSFAFSGIALSVDGKPVTNLQETETGIFSAGIVRAGTEAVDFFGAVPGAALATTGQEGYFAVLDGLSKGTHVVKSAATTTQFGHSSTVTHTDIIKVDG